MYVKQWKNGEQFSAKDYTSERDGLVEKLNSVDSKVILKGKQKLLLSEKTPKDNYEGLIWMDPQIYSFLFKQAQENITYSSDTQSYGFIRKSAQPLNFKFYYDSDMVVGRFEVEDRGFENLSLSYSSETTSNKVPYLESGFSDSATYESESFGYKMPSLKSSFSGSTTYTSETTSYVTPFLNSGFTDSLTYVSEVFGYKVPLLESSFSDSISYTSVTTSNAALDVDRAFLENITYFSESFAYKSPQLKEQFSENITYQSEVSGNPKLLVERLFSEAVTYESSNVVVTPRQFIEKAFNENIDYESTLTGTPRQLLERSFSENITYESNTVATPRQLLERSFSENINYLSETAATPYLKLQRSFSDNITYESSFVSEQVTTYLVKGYTTVGPVDITVNFSDEPAFGFTFGTFEQILGNKVENTTLTVTAPSSILVSGTTYTFVDWLVSQTGESSTDTQFTTTINQAKTLRVRYVAFAFN